MNDDDLAQIRDQVAAKGGTTRAQTTLRYWNQVQKIDEEEDTKAAQRISKELGKVEWTLNPLKAINRPNDVVVKNLGNELRNFESRVKALPTENVDADAVDAALAYATFCHEFARLIDSSAGTTATILAELYNKKLDTLSSFQEQGNKLAVKGQDIIEYLHNKRSALKSKYNVAFPDLIPTARIGLQPYFLGGGYYVKIFNTSGEELKNVILRYTAANGGSVEQKVADYIPFSPTVDTSVKINPADVKWKLDKTDSITIKCENGSFSQTFSTAELMTD